MRAALVHKGYTVLEAATGEEAISVAQSYSGCIDLLITDHLFRKTTGREIAERIKRTRPDMKVLHMSGHFLETLQDAGLTPGAAFLQKPFSVQSLADSVRIALTSKSSCTCG